MLKFSREGKYNIIATKYESESLTIYIGFDGDFPPKELFIINKFKYCEETKQIFKKIFMYFSSKNKPESFCDFFSIKDHFYAVFKYKEEQSLSYKYNKKICITDFRKRVKVFEYICVKVRSCIRNSSPLPVILAMIDPDNISIDEKDEVFFNFDMRNVKKQSLEEKIYHQDKDKYITKRMSKIFNIIFGIELSSKYNRIMKLISKKCDCGIYNSLEELVIDLKNNIDEAEISSFWEYIKYQYKTRKRFILKAMNRVLISGMIVAVGFLSYAKLTKLDNGYKNSKSLTIGDVTYSANSKDKSPKSVDLEDSSKSIVTEPSKTKAIYIPKNSNISFDDYIVQDGDTPSSISESSYSDRSLSPAITSFNDVTGYLIPGSILKIPQKSVIDAMQKA